MPNIGLPEIAILLIIALIVFGPKRLPELGRSLGRGIREFRGSVSGDRDEHESRDEHEPRHEDADADSRREIEAPPPAGPESGDSEPVAHDRR